MNNINQWDCECVNQISAQLKEQNEGKHTLPFRDMMNWSEGYSYVTLAIYLHKTTTDKPDYGKILTPSFCPFCGTKYKTSSEIYDIAKAKEQDA